MTQQTIASLSESKEEKRHFSLTTIESFRFLFDTKLHCILILALIFICFGRSLTSYFIADDIGEIKYVWHIFQGNWQLLISNFTGNYMQVPNMNVYRPVLLLTLVLDYFIWQNKAFGYFLSNLFYFSASTLSFYFCLRTLFSNWGLVRSSLCALISSLLFALNPLHCESISWIVGRVDSACCTFYLLSYYFCIANAAKNSILNKALSIIFFALAICTKEMAIGLAPLLACTFFLFPELMANKKNCKTETEYSLRTRLKVAWQASSTIWLATTIYFVIRYFALGTLLGGYTGSIGAAQSNSALTKWLDPDTWHRFFFPFANEIFSNNSQAESNLAIMYTLLLSLCFFRLITLSLPGKRILFLALWGITAALPIYRLWGLGLNLESARFCYFLSLPFSALLPTILFAPSKKNIESISTRILLIALPVFFCFISLFFQAAQKTNLLWVHAGKTVYKFQQEALKILSLNQDKKIILLNIPKEHGGAHMILNGVSFQMLLSEPFTQKNYANSFITFDPLLYGDDTRINSARFTNIIQKSRNENNKIIGPYVWSNKRNNFDKIDFVESINPQETSINLLSKENINTSNILPYIPGHAQFIYNDNSICINNCLKNDSLLITNLDTNPLDYAYLKLVFQNKSEKESKTLAQLFEASWSTNNVNNLSLENFAEYESSKASAFSKQIGKNKNKQEVYIPLAKFWKWYTHPKINMLQIVLPQAKQIRIDEIKLLPYSLCAPIVRVKESSNKPIGNKPAQNDFYNELGFSELNKPITEFEINARNIEQANSLLLEISKADYFFDNCPQNNNKQSEAILKSFVLPGKESNFILKNSDLKEQGFYQIRVSALDPQGQIIGDYSDPINIHKTTTQLP